MRAIPGVDVGALRELFSSPDPIASVYVDVRGTGEQDALARWRPIRDRLAEQAAGSATLSALTERVLGSVPGRGVLAVFAAAEDVLFAVDMPGSAQPDLGVYATLPHLAPLLSWLQDHPALVAAVVDRAGADILVYPSGPRRSARWSPDQTTRLSAMRPADGHSRATNAGPRTPGSTTPRE